MHHLISSRPQMFFKIGVRKILLIWQENICVWVFFAGLRDCNFIKKRLQHRCFPVKLAKFLRTPFFKNTSGGCFCTYCTHMTSHAIWVDEITDIMVSIKRSIEAKTFWKNSFLKLILHNFSFSVIMYIYINTEYWPEYSFKTNWNDPKPSKTT